jgi:4-amino-4-deoxy-L-arabinose transferase-like glycosyltransferase
MSIKNSKKILFLIIFLAIILRIVNLENWPIIFNQDEALNGYEAYSILKTGRDHRNNPWPIFFEGFSDKVDNRLPFYIYFSVPFVAIFGLNKFAIRLPAVILGVLTVLITYYLAKELFEKESIGLLSAFLLAISPWHIFLSRTGLEVISVPFFSVLTIFFFIKGVKKKKVFLLLSAISLALLFYTYHIAKLFTPLLGITLLIFYWKEIGKNKFWLLISFLIFLIVSFPFLFLQISNWTKIQERFNQISIFNYSFWPILFIRNFLTYFSLKSLLKFYPIFTILFFLISIIFFLEKELKLILILLLVSLIPTSLTLPNPHSNRAVSTIPFVELIAAFAPIKFLNETKKIKNFPFFKIVFSLILLSLFLLNLNFLIKNDYPYNFYRTKLYIPKELIDYIKENLNKYEKVVFTDKANQPYIFFLFFLKYDPKKFQSLNVEREYLLNNLQIVKSFDKFKFCNLNHCYHQNENNLYVARSNEISHLKPKKIFYDKEGLVYRIITND